MCLQGTKSFDWPAWFFVTARPYLGYKRVNLCILETLVRWRVPRGDCSHSGSGHVVKSHKISGTRSFVQHHTQRRGLGDGLSTKKNY